MLVNLMRGADLFLDAYRGGKERTPAWRNDISLRPIARITGIKFVSLLDDSAAVRWIGEDDGTVTT